MAGYAHASSARRVCLWLQCLGDYCLQAQGFKLLAQVVCLSRRVKPQLGLASCGHDASLEHCGAITQRARTPV